MTNGVSRVHKVLGMWSRTHQNWKGLPITACLLHVSFLVASHLLSLAFSPVGSIPLMALFLEPSLYSVSNASESLEQWASISQCQAQPCQLYRNPGQWGDTTCPKNLSPFRPLLASPKLWQSLSENDPVTLKQQYTPQWVLQQYDYKEPASIEDNYLNKKISLKNIDSANYPLISRLEPSIQLHLKIWSWNEINID